MLLFVCLFLNFYSLRLQGCLPKDTTRFKNIYSNFCEHSSFSGSENFRKALEFTKGFFLPEVSFGLHGLKSRIVLVSLFFIYGERSGVVKECAGCPTAREGAKLKFKFGFSETKSSTLSLY